MVAMEIPTYPFTVEDVPLGVMRIDDAYQRPENKPWIERTLNSFNPLLIGTMICNRRENGEVYLIDGQQRKVVLMEVGFDAVHAVMLDGLTQQEEAAIFYRINRDRMKISPWYDFRARLVADEVFARDVNGLVHLTGFSLGASSNNSDVIGAIRATERSYTMVSDVQPVEGRALRAALLAIRRNWKGRARSLDKILLVGMTRFYVTFGDDVMSGTMDELMEKVSPNQVLGMTVDRSKGRESGGPSGLVLAGVLFDEYNKLVARENRLSAKKWKSAKVRYFKPGEDA